MSSNQAKRGPPVAYNFLQEIPIKYQQRSCTDICCTVIGVVFSLVLFIMALCLFNWDNYVKSSFPTDSDGQLCGVDAAGYPFVYFANPPEIARRVCVSSCPTSDSVALDCLVTQEIGCKFSGDAYGVNKYDTYEYNGGRAGSYCLPTDETLKQQLVENAKIQNRTTFINSVDTITLSIILASSFSLLYVVLVQCFPKAMNKIVIVLGALVILALSICMFAYHWNAYGKILIAVLLLILFFIIVLSSCKNRRAIEMNGVFLSNASQMLRTKKCTTFFYIPLFIAFLTGFVFMMIYEFRSFWTGGSLGFDATQSIFWEFNSAGPVVLTVFLVIQIIWGLSFLKEAFNFVVSGNAVSWYYHPDGSPQSWSCVYPLKTMLLKHFGSVVGGSFMTGFFTVGDYLVDLLKPRISEKKTGCHYRSFKLLCSPCEKVFDLVRSDAMAHINIAGNPYCNAARYCEYLSDNSVVLEQAQSTSRTYRLCAHFLIAGIVGIICLYIKGEIVPTALLVIIVLSLFISTFFISIHADAAEAISISFMDNEECEKRKLQQGGQSFGGPRETTFDNMAVMHREIAEQVKRVLISHPYKEETFEY